MPDQEKITANNNTGLPVELKAGIADLSGIEIDNVKVHYNSPKPAELQAQAFASGEDIHLDPGGEKHLSYATRHVAQQKQGRVQPNMQRKGTAVNDDAGLEKEADKLGSIAANADVADVAGSPADFIMINNAGIVITGPFINTCFERLGLVENGSFGHLTNQYKAISVLQYLITGQDEEGPTQPALFNLLCGLSSTHHAMPQPVIHEHRAIADSLLAHIIVLWPELDSTPVDGLRKSFLQRDGRLSTGDDVITLLVQRKPYDLLLDQLPWDIAMIKLPWMPKAIQVIWK